MGYYFSKTKVVITRYSPYGEAGVFERRRHPRVLQRRKVGVILSSGKVVYLWTYEVSKNGLQLLSDASAEVGRELDIFFHVLDPQTDEYVRLDARTRVVHVLYDGTAGTFRIGMALLGFKGDGQAVFERSLVAAIQAHHTL